MIYAAFDMETQDPDDVLTLCLLATHPSVYLLAVTVNPGSRAQVGVVRHVLARLGKGSVQVGSGRPDHPKKCVSSFHYRWLGDVPEADADGRAPAVLHDAHEAACGGLTLVTGGPLTNVADYLSWMPGLGASITIQGGFAGDSVVPEPHRLEKFAGRETCPTFNLNGDVAAAKAVLAYRGFRSRRLVSKNVCHGVAWDREMHERVRPSKDAHSGLAMVFDAMELYLRNKPSGKLLHDPLAACAAIDPSFVTWAEVEVYRERGEWGSRLSPGSGTRISVAVDRSRFEQLLIG